MATPSHGLAAGRFVPATIRITDTRASAVPRRNAGAEAPAARVHRGTGIFI